MTGERPSEPSDGTPADEAFGLSVAPAGSVPPPPPTDRRRRASPPDPSALVERLTAGDRAALARAITLLESTRQADRGVAAELLAMILPRTRSALRLGVTGVPGVGKSTLIESLGVKLLERGERLAVLAVDPAAARSGGAILGDKTRMPARAAHPLAFVRPSPSGSTLGGVAARTRETILLCEAAGCTTVLVETVGVGQSETAVAEMTDLFLALLLPGAGDELQGIKRGIIELADVLAINKADGDAIPAARRAAASYRGALDAIRPRDDGWTAPVLLCSARTGDGLDTHWTTISDRVDAMQRSGARDRLRRDQASRWLRSAVRDRAADAVLMHPDVRAVLAEAERAVTAGEAPATIAAERVATAIARAVHLSGEACGSPD